LSEYQYCPKCGTKLDSGINYCAKCGNAISPQVRSIEDTVRLRAEAAEKSKRALIAYLLAFFITGTGHIYLGYVGKGVTILILAIMIGLAGWMVAAGGSPLGLFFGLLALPLWIYQLIDAHTKIKKMNIPM
jgi:hypothetical protein